MIQRKTNASFLEKEAVLLKEWGDTDDIMILIPVCKSGANAIRQKLTITLDSERKEAEKIEDPIERNKALAKCHYFNTKPILIPINRLVEIYKIDVERIFKEAEKIRGYRKRKI